MGPILLSDAIEEYVAYRRTAYTKSTAKLTKIALEKFLRVVGNVQVRSLGPAHGERFQSWLLHQNLKPNSVNSYMRMLSTFTRWCIAHRYITQGNGPIGTVRALPAPSKPKLRVPVRDFERLLETNERPDVRLVVALGLYLFLRASEISSLTLADVDLAAGEVSVFIQKTNEYDVMPICEELDAELRRWLTVYTQDVAQTFGPLSPNCFLVPSRINVLVGRAIPEAGLYLPLRKKNLVSRLVHLALSSSGYALQSTDGESNREGVHTLRRSGARALYDELITSEGVARDDALRKVGAMLHHKNTSVTELYIGLEVDKERRNVMLKGQRMFRKPENANVTPLRREV